MSQLYIHENLVRIQPLVHKILAREESVMPMPMLTPTPTGFTQKLVCPRPLQWGGHNICFNTPLFVAMTIHAVKQHNSSADLPRST